MNTSALLREAFGRLDGLVPAAVEDLAEEQLAHRPDDRGNSIAWLIWHLSRVQDDHVADAAGTEQVWSADGWRDRFGLVLPADATGYGHDADDVAAVRATADLLNAYYAAVATRTAQYVDGLAAADLDRVVDGNWSPPVTLGARLISVLSDCLQHAGQAGYVRGLVLG